MDIISKLNVKNAEQYRLLKRILKQMIINDNVTKDNLIKVLKIVSYEEIKEEEEIL